MGFNEEIELEANRLKFGKIKYSPKAIDTAMRKMKERNDAGGLAGLTTWPEVQEEFHNEISRCTPRKSKPYRSGKRSSK
jgi:hypothetical protein